MRTAVRRVASAVVLIPPFVWAVAIAPPWIFALLVVAIGATALWELVRMFQQAGHPVSAVVTIVCGTAVTGSFLAPGALVPTLTAAVVVILGTAVWRPGPPTTQATFVALLGVSYIGVLLGHALLLHRLPSGAWLVLFVAGVTWVGETAAYVIGSLVGRHRLAPRISPGKTIEGAVGQLLASVGGALLLAPLTPGLDGVTATGAGALIGVIGQVGDLAESVIKRGVGAKDAGELIPGHGGLLDRLDGLLFSTPAFFYYVSLVGGRP
jgi:phosphatidate cytidylyltransferase